MYYSIYKAFQFEELIFLVNTHIQRLKTSKKILEDLSINWNSGTRSSLNLLNCRSSLNSIAEIPCSVTSTCQHALTNTSWGKWCIREHMEVALVNTLILLTYLYI